MDIDLDIEELQADLKVQQEIKDALYVELSIVDEDIKVLQNNLTRLLQAKAILAGRITPTEGLRSRLKGVEGE